MIRRRVISLLLTFVVLIAASVPFSVSAEDADAKDQSSEPSQKDTYTYYFLAPEFWIDTAQGAENENVGVYFWEPFEVGDYPGVQMTPAPEVGENVFKAEIPKETSAIIFNDGFNYGTSIKPNSVLTRTADLLCQGYGDDFPCPYDSSIKCDSFDGWIFVLNFHETTEHQLVVLKCNGAWFKLDDYKNYDEYYGSYPERQAAPKQTIMGDINGDGKVTSSDALAILRISAGLDADDEELHSVADFDSDGRLTSADALAALTLSLN